MMNYLKKATFLLFGFTTISSCTNNHSNKMGPSRECIKLNDDGTQLLLNYRGDNKDELDKAINLFKQAINCDTTYSIAYVNLANAYDHEGSYKEEMACLNRLLVLNNDDPTILVLKGMLFERMNQIDSAKQIYSLTKTAYEKRIAKTPNDINLIKGKIELKALTDGKSEAIKELREQIKTHPNLSSKLTEEYYFYEHFDRHAHIYGYGN